MDRAAVTAVLEKFIGRKVDGGLRADIKDALLLPRLADAVEIYITGPGRLAVNVTKDKERQVFVVEGLNVNI